MFKDIKSSVNRVSAEPVNKGWSDDKKYLVKTASGERLLLRVSDIDGMVRRARAAFADYDNFKSVVPKWYTDEYRKK